MIFSPSHHGRIARSDEPKIFLQHISPLITGFFLSNLNCLMDWLFLDAAHTADTAVPRLYWTYDLHSCDSQSFFHLVVSLTYQHISKDKNRGVNETFLQHNPGFQNEYLLYFAELSESFEVGDFIVEVGAYFAILC